MSSCALTAKKPAEGRSFSTAVGDIIGFSQKTTKAPISIHPSLPMHRHSLLRDAPTPTAETNKSSHCPQQQHTTPHRHSS